VRTRGLFLPAALATAITGCGDSGAAGGGAAGSAGSAATGGSAAGAGGDAGDAGSSGGAAGASGSGAGMGGEAGDGGVAEICPPSALSAGSTTDVSLDFGGATRRYLLHVPSGWDGLTPLPLVLNFHGFTYSADQQPEYTGMSPVADANGFAVAYPDGIGNSWNGGACCGSAASGNVDDVGFARAVVADAQSRICVDRRRVYATGMSNGGFLSHRIACEAADLVAAVAPVAGVLGIDAAACNPSRPVPVMHFHGTSDVIVPYGGNPLIGYVSVAETIDGWAARDGCSGAPSVTFTNGSAHCETRACAEGTEVVLCTIDGMGHCWPGRATCLFTASTDISATEAMWPFFQKFALP
jgi:polyhydroxybutyrate depolymerase